MHFLLKSSCLIHLVSAFSHTLPFSSTPRSSLSNSLKYRAILLDKDYLDGEPDTFEGWRAYAAHFLVRTTATPLGPNLNPSSENGITDQTMPLVGYDILTQNNMSGYWPLFATTSSNLQVDSSSAYWVPVYTSSGAQSSVSCANGEVVIGVRYSSHISALKLGEGGSSGSPLSQIPDIQCAKLSPTTMVDAVDYNSVHQVSVTVANGSDTAQVSTTKSVMDVKQCMISGTNNVGIKRQDTTFNTCYGSQVTVSSSSSSTSSSSNSTASTTSSGSVMLLEYLLALKPSKMVRTDRTHKSNVLAPSYPEVLEFLISEDSADPYSADALFGSISSESANQQLLTSIQNSQQNAVAQASANYSANFNQPAPSVDQINQELGPTPWNSDQLIANSAEFVSGSLISGGNVTIVRGFTAGDPSSGGSPLQLVCGNVIGCAHGDCVSDTCKCQPGFGGHACMDQLDPCLNKPCGMYGVCAADFTSANATASGNYYTCTCNPGWSGNNCEITSDKCAIPDPNGGGLYVQADCGHGVCVPNTDSAGYTCGCNMGWTNDVSSNSTSPCNTAQTDCQGVWTQGQCDANCQQTQTYAILSQASGSGKACPATDGQTKSSTCFGGACKQCQSRDCNGKGSCDATTGACVCQSGWTGDNCELSTDACSASLCNSHGNCNADQTGCVCMNGWLNAGKQSSASNSTNSTSVTSPVAPVSYCTVDPCDGCPPGKCNTYSGYCSCDETVDDFNAFPACKRMFSSNCVGQWGEWGPCNSQCTQIQYFSIVTPNGPGGAPCSNKVGDTQSQTCSVGSCCKLDATQCKNGSAFQPNSCSCACPVGYQGTFCETQSQTAMRTVQIEQTVAVSNLGALGASTRAPVTVSTDSTEPAPAPTGTSIWLYVGIAAGALLVIGGGAFFFMSKSSPPAGDPLLAGMEGLEGMDLTGMDLSALGLDATGAAAEPAPL